LLKAGGYHNEKYECVAFNSAGEGLINPGFEDHRAVIDEYAAKGYRYVGWFPLRSGSITEDKVDHIFEKDE